nr:MAG TPA: hypothetical protein [Caudoviricetes sp.]
MLSSLFYRQKHRQVDKCIITFLVCTCLTTGFKL